MEPYDQAGLQPGFPNQLLARILRMRSDPVTRMVGDQSQTRGGPRLEKTTEAPSK